MIRTTLLVAAAAAGCAAPNAPQPAAHEPATLTAADQSFLTQYAQTHGFTLGRPASITVTPDGKTVLFLRSQPRSPVQSLFAFDVATGQERELLTAEKVIGAGGEKLTAEELARRERMRLTARGIAAYQLSEDGTKILVPLSGDLYVVELASGTVTKLPHDDKFPIDPMFSNDGTRVACVRDGELCLIDIASASERKLTSGATAAVTNALAEFVAQEEMDRFRGYWWSPDDKLIVYQQTDTSEVETFTIADPLKPEVAPNSWPYPRAGKNNAKVKLGLMPATGGTTTWVKWDAVKYPYLATVKWPKGGPPVMIVQNRAQTEEVLLKIDPATGATSTLLVEADPAWIELDQSMPKWLEDGSGFLWTTQRGGTEQLELRHADGSLARVITPPGLGFQNFVSLDDRRGMVYVLAHPDPTQAQLWRVPLDTSGGASVRLTDSAAMHAATFAKRHGAYVVSRTATNDPAAWTVFTEDGRAAGAIKSIAESPAVAPKAELTTVTGARTYNAVIFRPSGFITGRKYPVLVNVYGGPTALTATSYRKSGPLDQWMADQGFIVVSIDGRGTPGRGREWDRCIKGNLIDIALEDQVDGVRALCAAHPEMDASRVGMYGWSFGGYFSAMAAMRRPDVFAAGVAGAPVCDWADYDTHYTERYMGLPQENKSGYEASDVETYAKDLRVPLLIIHGTADDNVYFLHALKMTNALFRAGKPFEFLPLSGFTHVVRDPEVVSRLNGRIVTFFKTNLGESK